MSDLLEDAGCGAACTNDQEASDFLEELWREHDVLVETLQKQEKCRDVALEMRLLIVRLDLGLYRPSAP